MEPPATRLLTCTASRTVPSASTTSKSTLSTAVSPGGGALHPDAGNLRIVDHRNQPLQGAQVLVVKPPRRATSPVHARVSLPRSARRGGLAARAMISPQG